MSGGPLSGGPLSGGPWEPGDGEPEPSGPRYEPGGKLGAGGMGEVRVARDAVLGRDVALKTAHRPVDEGALLAEARVTARLQHPGILPVYDAGRLPDGRAFYAARVLPGRSLADALSEPGVDRLSLVRHVLDAANALAYAHDAGVLHRDLHPGNLMIGAYGETVVADWGLATEAGDVVSRGAGTPGFMAPEQAAGGRMDARSDVYALGAVLCVVLGADGPAELRAVVARATADDPASRYPSMQALAADLDAWFQGRRVAAHVYAPGELLRRWLWRWRAPVGVGLIASILLVAVGAVGVRRTAEERDRAVAAEAEVLRHLAVALVAQAGIAAEQERRLDAEVLAASALRVGPSAEARGVLARFGGRDRPKAVRRGAVDDCTRGLLSADGRFLLCMRDRAVHVFDVDDGLRPVAELAGAAVNAAVSPDGRSAVLLGVDQTLWRTRDGAPGVALAVRMSMHTFGPTSAGDGVVLIGGHTAAVVPFEGDAPPEVRGVLLCEGLSAAAVLRDGDVVGNCLDGSVARNRVGGEPRRWVEVGPGPEGPSAIAPAGDGAVVGTRAGEVLVVDGAGVALARWRVGDAAVRRLAVSDTFVAVLLDDGLLTVIERTNGRIALRARQPGAAIAWRDAGTLRVLSAGAVEDWAVPVARWPHRTAVGGGVSAVGLSPDGAEALVGLGGGASVRWALPSGTVTPWTLSAEHPIKDVAVADDGGIAVARAGPGGQLRGAWGGAWRAFDARAMRRVGWARGGLVGLTYDQRALVWPDGGTDGAPGRLVSADLWDLDCDGERCAAVETGGGVWWLDGGGAVRLATVAGARAVGVLGADVLVAGTDGLVRLAPDGSVRGVHPVAGEALDVRASGDGRLIALGLLDGSVEVRDADGALLARLHGHVGRVPIVRFVAGDAWLVSSSWDGSVRLWWMGALDVAATEVLAELAAVGAPSLEAALAAGGTDAGTVSEVVGAP